MISSIGIIGFLILLYTAYLILTEGSDKNKSQTEEASESETEVTVDERPKQNPKKSTPVQTIMSEDDGDVLRQGKGYTEQVSAEQPNITPVSEQHFESTPERVVSQEQAPSTKNSDTEVEPEVEMISIKCPYCDNIVQVPMGGTAECSCCSSTLNDSGKVVS